MKVWFLGVVAFMAAGCQERLAMPSTCPELCPGEGLIIRDTVLLPITGRDSTYLGYIGATQITALLASNGLPAGEARAWAIFPRRPDSVFVLGVRYAYTIDSAAILVHITARDTAVKDLRLIVHRIPLPVDSTTTLADLDPLLTLESVVDSVRVPDTLRSGDVRMVLPAEAVSRLDPDETDSTRFALAFRVNAPVPTGVRLGSTFSAEGGPVYLTYVQAPTPDTTLRRQTISLPADSSNYVLEPPPVPGPEVLYLGGRSGSRIILRFRLPAFIRDSSTVIRATLELTPVGPLKGLPNDPAELQTRAVLIDVGAKSPAFAGTVGLYLLRTEVTEVQSFEVRGPVSTWFGPGGLTPTLLLGLAPEGGTFSRPEFFSSLAPAGAPRLRLTYATSARPGFP